MTESIKFGPEWLRNSVANVVASAPSSQQPQQPQHHHQQPPQSPSIDSIISRPVLSDHRYGREEMLSLCDKTARLPDALPRFRRLYVAEWQIPLALQPNTDDDQIGSRGLGGPGAQTWGTHIRPLMPAMGGRGTGIIRGGAIERGGRGRGRGLYHGTSYTRSTSLYDEEGRRWIDRNGTDPTAEWSAGNAVSPRKEGGFSRSALESWRKGTRDDNEEGWRSSNNGTAQVGPTTTTPTGGPPPPREKWQRSTSWRDGTAENNGITTENNGQPGMPHQNSASPVGGVPIKPPIVYKKSWDEESNLPEWATESFDYGGTFDASGAFHDGERAGSHDEHEHHRQMHQQHQMQQQQKQKELKKAIPIQRQSPQEVDDVISDVEPSPPPASKLMDFLKDSVSSSPSQQHHHQTQQIEKPPKIQQQPIDIQNGPSLPPVAPAPIAQMDKMVENFVAHLIMDDDTSSSVKQPPAPIIEWFYRDPQGDTQGPFSSSDMSEWYKAGYFQENLMVRRSIDSSFTPLGHLVKIFGPSRPFITASMDGGPPIPLQPEVIDPFRLQRMMTSQPPPPVVSVPPPQQPQSQQQQSQPPTDVNNWSMMTAEQRIFFMQLAQHQRQPPPQQQQQPQSVVPDPYVMKPSPQSAPLDMRRMMTGNDFFNQSTSVPPPQTIQQQPVVPQTVQQQAPQQNEPDPIQQLIMQLQMQQKTGGDAAQQQQWMKPPSQQQQMMQGNNNGPMDLSSALSGLQSQQHQQQGVGVSGSSGIGVGNNVVVS